MASVGLVGEILNPGAANIPVRSGEVNGTKAEVAKASHVIPDATGWESTETEKAMENAELGWMVTLSGTIPPVT